MKIYIPKMGVTVSKNTIKEQFHSMGIGNVFYIDIHRKINKNKPAYNFAFVNIELYNSKVAEQFTSYLHNNNCILYYNNDANSYWEVKPFIEKKKRISMNICNKDILFDNITRASSFTEEDNIDLLNEYEILEKEIHQMIIAEQLKTSYAIFSKYG